jgi:hypothetical protein
MEPKISTLIATEWNDVVFTCLVKYWNEQGFSSEQAMSFARKAIEKLRNNTCDETWCLLPDQEQSP